MSKVSVVKCEEYDPKLLKEKILEGLNNINFDPKIFSNKKVVLKPNLLAPATPAKAVITHPLFFDAIAEIIIENNGIPILIESPAINSVQTVLKKGGYDEIIKKHNIKIADNKIKKEIHFDGDNKFKNIEVAESLLDADIIVNMPKCKTHGLTYFTGAVKNLFGLIPGMDKSKMHLKLPQKTDFSDFMLDLQDIFLHGIKKDLIILNIMDAILGMEGEGPSNAGNPKKINAIITSLDGVAVDYTAAKLCNLDINKIITVKHGFKRNFFSSSPEDIEFSGNDIDEMIVKDFIPAKGSFFILTENIPFLTKTAKNLLTDKPVPREDKCTLCYKCKTICPADAISLQSGTKNIPDFNYSKCIRCYCCMEVCPEAAIVKKSGMLQWILG
jgi:uncharacterized protein (DUF362 family)/Pyruvate/2-oxoacid:ferredoxin oxidoreductase delta subunit